MAKKNKFNEENMWNRRSDTEFAAVCGLVAIAVSAVGLLMYVYTLFGGCWL